ncbi:epoxide hydrolase 1 [Beauveria bassiana ARSEF 2860]|uniref:Epoxide hydrolase 1 n=1 Tax=Beauveria bassiana (strain ARSEF 2860) TaxID=655819 RepID=J5K825_BEAB2|nr:epoxide hydrolase 1 [Beauveria bassiana ARSEF 2860]EJP70246.1 epoxide hydrolase 1 [Beauveria bassiana ARSEF 2860]
MSSSIRPFKLSIAQFTLDDLQTRLGLTRWPDKEIVTDWSQGVPLAVIQELCEYWKTEYDWRRCEGLLNSYPQFTTTIDGVEFYFLHVRSRHQDALPLVLTHGWPGSILEFRHVIDQLVDPESHGRRQEDAFHLKWNYDRTAAAWIELMRRLGYEDSGWVAQGGDWGAHKESQIPIHDTKAENRAMHLDERRDAGFRGYSLQQSTRPQTIGYGLADSPVAQAAWIYEKYRDWSDHGGNVEAVLAKDEMLDTIMLYLLSNSGTSSARYYWENQLDTTAWPIDVPVGVSCFGGDNSYAPREWCERYYKNIVYWSETARGGHFAAWEVPDMFVSEVRAWKRRIK